MTVRLTDLARAGFSALSEAAEGIELLSSLSGSSAERLLAFASPVADPDAALRAALRLWEVEPVRMSRLWRDESAVRGFFVVTGASLGLAEFLGRHPEHLEALLTPLSAPVGVDELRSRFVDTVRQARVAASSGTLSIEEHVWVALRVAYRRELLRLAAWDVCSTEATEIQPQVSTMLADLAAAALDAALEAARLSLALEDGAPVRFGTYPPAEVAATRLAIIGMGKAGASELNYVSDVDVIYVAESADLNVVSSERAIEIATRLAQHLQQAIGGVALEPPLWEVDPNLRPEGKAGALVRTLDSHVQYYERWAKSWEFQALLKARAMAGDRELGAAYVAALAPKVWQSAARENFVESVQRMRERVTEHIPADEVDIQIKLGPGGLRDIEFTVQLLQLVHGKSDPTVRFGGTLPALTALAAAGYVGRAEAAQFSQDYRFLRVLEHRLQLARLRRTHLMPRDEEALRVLARASGLAATAEELIERWHEVRVRVRGLHERLFYRPLLAAVAATDSTDFTISNEQAEDRLAAIGFR
ncbi:MAG TPA: bifunctional glutamine-synthetase adenylyltransferase/deadenyltransferase, partial [Microbacteriaceae bacterium]|nr:bifunctional glutamine-synthetase adenylyltransferase/deadenyltransferase [Microbacteriaceae bacterium]